MGLKKLNRWFENILHGYHLPKLVKSKPWKIKQSDKICILTPHADDETIGCGGLLAMYGSQCDVILLTDGRLAGQGSPEEIVKRREDEFSEVMRFFKVHDFKMMRAQDNLLINSFDKFSQITDFRKYDYVVMPHGLDSHKDHVVVKPFFERLKKEQKGIKAKSVYYEVWGALAMPTHYLDISEVVDVKRNAINMYKSQTEKIDYAGRILALNHYRGIRHAVEFEEDFVIED